MVRSYEDRPRTRSPFALVLAALVAFPSASVGPVRAPGQSGFEITQIQGDTRIVTLLSPSGVASTQYDSSGAPLRASSIRYGDRMVIALDYSDHTAHISLLSTAVSNKLAENSRVANGRSIPDAGDIGGSPVPGPPVLTRLDVSGKIAGLNATAIGGQSGGMSVRIWYSTQLPTTPSPIAAALAPLLSTCAASNGEDSGMDEGDRGDGSQSNRSHTRGDDDHEGSDTLPTCDNQSASIARLLSKVVALRTEVLVNGTWMTRLDTSQIRRVRVAVTAFDPPAGFTPVPVTTAMASTAPSVPASRFSVPASRISDREISTGSVVHFPSSLPATVSDGPGPLMVHPDVYQFYWGRPFSAWKPVAFPGGFLFKGFTGSHYNDLFGGPGVGPNWYIRKLQQYGIVGGGVRNTYFIDDNPENAVGGFGTFLSAVIVAAHVVQWSFQTSAPSFWWIYGGHDPIYMIFVPRELLAPPVDGTTGYHLAAPAVANLLLPIFLLPFVHDFLPYGIADISQNAIPVSDTSSFFRQACIVTRSVSSACNALTTYFDAGTQIWTHELVEAITDPYPFFGWSDAAKQPAPSKSEIADICSQDNTFPYGSSTVVRDTVVATYFSGSDNACVPESRPTLNLLSPTAGQVVQWSGPNGPNVILLASSTDPTDGDISASISWTLDGVFLGQASRLLSGPLGLGSHNVQATVVDSQGLIATASATFSVFASPPTVRILAPADGTSVAAGSLVALRGDATDAQDRPLPDGAFEWNINGVVLAAHQRTVIAKFPTPGPVSIVLTVKNSASLSASAMANITVTPATTSPSVRITQPADGTVVKRADPNDPSTLTFTAIAQNADGTPFTGQIVWTDSVDGAMGTGPSVAFRLSGAVGPPTVHHVTVMVTSAGVTVTDMVTVTVVVLIP